jgi:uncharacterized protein (DUF362 family)/Pyruvate/2-oxoacid:ferredoxin oxidoreductase delta subunit
MGADSRVAIIRCADYGEEAVYRALSEAVDAAGGLSVTGKCVLLKPNIVRDAPPERAITTHPAFLAAAIRLVRARGAARVLVGDSPGVQPPGFQAKQSGLGAAALRYGAEWVDFTARTVGLSCPEGKMVKHFIVSAAVEAADVIISLPKLKTHELLYFTGAIKNLFGLVPSVQKSVWHVRFPRREQFAAMLVDLAVAVQADYALMDAVTGMEGPGPGAGYPRHIGAALASANLLALDMAACMMVGYPPREIPVNREALDRGLWLTGTEQIVFPALTPADMAVSDFQRIPFRRAGGQLAEFFLPPLRKIRARAEKRPRIQDEICVRCGDCARICASRAIRLEEGGAARRMIIDHRACIRCYCCHEICPAKAITLEKPARF